GGGALPAGGLLDDVLVLFIGVPAALTILAGPPAALGAAAGTAGVGALLVLWDRFGGICALGAAGPPALVASALLGLAFRVLSRRWPETLAGAGPRALVVPAAALAVALTALSHPFYYYPDVDTHARYLAAARADPYLLLD